MRLVTPASSPGGALPESMNPGEIALTVMPCGASNFASVRVRIRIAGFRNVVGCDVWLGNHLVGIGHAEVDDVTGLTRFHAGRDGLREIENGVEVAVEHLVPAFDGFFEEIDPMVGAGSVNEHIDLAPGLFDLGYQALRRNRIGHIAANGQRLPATFRDGERSLLGLCFARAIADGDVPMSAPRGRGQSHAQFLWPRL